MITIKLYAILPIHKFFLSKEHYKNYVFCLKNYIDELPNIISFLDNKFSKIKARKIEPTAKVKNLFNLLNPASFGINTIVDFIRIDAEYELDEVHFKDVNSNYKDIEKISYGGLVASFFNTVITDSLILSSLAFPGQLKSYFGQIFYKDHPLNLIHPVSGYHSGLFYDKIYRSWPKLEFLNILDVIRWESKLGLFKDGFATNSIQKAFASYSHILKHSSIDTYEMLFWAMQGLEGFYCNGKGELRNQLKEKSKLFLGNWQDKKNIVGHLYDLRSKFIHGDFPIERWKNEIQPKNKIEKEYNKLCNGTALAIQILIASLQRCIKEEIVDIDFKYSLIKNKTEPAALLGYR